jgi:hypothetical protein
VDSNSLINKRKPINDLFQVILSNGFPRLRICTAIGVGCLDSCETWTNSPALRRLVLDTQTLRVYEQILVVCPNLRPYKRHPQIESSIGMTFFS